MIICPLQYIEDFSVLFVFFEIDSITWCMQGNIFKICQANSRFYQAAKKTDFLICLRIEFNRVAADFPANFDYFFRNRRYLAKNRPVENPKSIVLCYGGQPGTK